MGYSHDDDSDDDSDESDESALSSIVVAAPIRTQQDDTSNDTILASPLAAATPPKRKRGRPPGKSSKAKSLTVSDQTTGDAAIASPAISDAVADRSRRRVVLVGGDKRRRLVPSKRKPTHPHHNAPLVSVDDIVDDDSSGSLRRVPRNELVAKLDGAEHVHAGATETIFVAGDLFIAARQFVAGQYEVDGARKSHVPFVDDGIVLAQRNGARDDAMQFGALVASHALAPVLGKRPNATALAAHRRQLQAVTTGASVYALARSPNARSMAPAVGDLTDRAVAKMMTQALRTTSAPTTVARLASEIAPHFHPARPTDVLQRVHAQRDTIFAHNANVSGSSSSAAAATWTSSSSERSRRSSQR